MNEIIDELYALLPPVKRPHTPEEEELWTEYLSMSDQVKNAFGLQFLDRFTLLKAELDDRDGLGQFRQGFRLGAGLMLEVLETEAEQNG